MSDKQAILEYVEFNGSFVPAKMIGKQWRDHFFGSEIGARCRELRKQGKLQSIREGKYERYLRVERKPLLEYQPIEEHREETRLFELPKITSV